MSPLSYGNPISRSVVSSKGWLRMRATAVTTAILTVMLILSPTLVSTGSVEYASMTVDVYNQEDLPPVTTCPMIGGNGTDTWFNHNVTVFLEATDDSGIVNETRYRVDGGEWGLFSEYHVISGDGNHTLEYYSIDGAGNIEDTKSRMFKIDTEAPRLAIVWPEDHASVNTEDVTVCWICEDDMSGVGHFEVMIDGGGSVGYSEWHRNVTIEHPRGGTHRVWIRAWDVAGNTAIAEITFSVDDMSYIFVMAGLVAALSVMILIPVALGRLAQRWQLDEL